MARRALDAVLWVAAAVLFGGAAYSLADALGWLTLSPVPGVGPPHDDLVGVAALLAFLVGTATLAYAAWFGEVGGLAAPVFCLAGAAYVVAAFYTFDPYYAPTLRRMSQGGAVSAGWLYLLTAAIVVAALAWFAGRRRSMAVAPVLLFLCGLTALWEPAGH